MNREGEYFPTESDAQIGFHILAYPNSDFRDVVRQDGRWEIVRHLSALPRALMGWYPFSENCSVLQLEAGFGALTGQLSQVCGHVTALESDPYRAFCLRKRYEALENITVLTHGIEALSQKFDYIVYVADADAKPPRNLAQYRVLIGQMKARLCDGGKLLLVLPNRFGLKYWCGEPDPGSKLPFDGIGCETGELHRFGRKKLLAFLQEAGFGKIKFYYPLPDHQTPQLIYTDAYPPKADLCERLRPFIMQKGSRVLNETEVFDALAKEGNLLPFANSFFVECGEGACSDIVYAAVSAERREAEAFATVIRSATVEKIALYGAGERGLARLADNTRELAARGIPVLPLELAGRRAVMRRVDAPSLSEHIRALIGRRDGAALLACIDRLYAYNLASSEQVDAKDNALRQLAPQEDWGPILRKAYIEMIPVNCFFVDGAFLFFDQEFSRERYPAKYVLFRAVRDIYAFFPEAESVVSLQAVKERWGLTRIWEYFQEEEWRFQRELRQEDVYTRFFQWIANDDVAMRENRSVLQMRNLEFVPPVNALFNAVADLGQRRIVLFGAGKMAEYYLDKYGEAYPPLFIVDNCAEKWGTSMRGIAVKAPAALGKLVYGTFRVVIASNAYEEMAAQLSAMGIYEDSFRIYQRRMDELLPTALVNGIADGKYEIGYVTGVFDLFHIGHLNLLRRCKERCRYLIAGVLTDALTERDKRKKPYIPFAERMEIVKQCKYVDRVIAVDFHNTDKVEAWAELRYGCLFSGSDHEGEPYWLWLRKRLRCLGAELEFFPYTQGTSSTRLQAVIRERLEGK